MPRSRPPAAPARGAGARLRLAVARATDPLRNPAEWVRTAAVRSLPLPVRERLVRLLRPGRRPAALPSPPRPPGRCPPPVPARRAAVLLAEPDSAAVLAAGLEAWGWESWIPPGAGVPVRGARHLPVPLEPGRRHLRALRRWQRDLRYHDVAVLCAEPGGGETAVHTARALGWPLAACDDGLATADAAAAHDRLLRAFPPVSVVVVTHRNLALTRLCLESVLGATAYPRFEVIVVDNASDDGTPELLRRLEAEDPRVRAVLEPRNTGFAAACNEGVRRASGEVLCLLNNDTVASTAWLSALVRALQTHPDLGLVGAATNAIGNSARVTVGYGSLAEMPAWAEAWSWAHHRQLRPVPMVALFCAAIPRRVWDTVGGLDERFGVGMFEDDDLAVRIRRAGLRVAVARDAFVHHWHQAAFGLLDDAAYRSLYERNRLALRHKWRRAPGGRAP